MSYYSSHSSYATPSRGSIQRASYYNSPIHSRNYSSQERGGLSERARYKVLSFRPPQHPSNRLGSLIGRFEALDAVSRSVEIFEPKLVPVQHSTSFLQSNIKGGSQPNRHQWRLSTIFSPRPASQGRYENVFPEDESPPDKDDVFTCPPYHSVGSIKKSEILKLRQMPSLTKVAVVQAQDPTKTVGRNALSECPAPSFHKVLPIRSNSREASIRDKIRFFDGGTDPRTPPALPTTKQIKIKTSPLRQSSGVSVVPGSGDLNSSINLEACLNAGLRSHMSSQASEVATTPLKLAQQQILAKQYAILGTPTSNPFLTPVSTLRSSTFVFPDVSPRARSIEPNSSQRSGASPLRERRLARSAIPKRAGVGVSTPEGRGHSQPPRPTRQISLTPKRREVSEKIDELYRAKHRERLSSYIETKSDIEDQSAPPDMKLNRHKIQVFERPIQTIQVTGAKKVSRVADLKARFSGDSDGPALNPMRLLHITSPRRISQGRNQCLEGESKIITRSQLMPEQSASTAPDLSIILEKGEQSFLLREAPPITLETAPTVSEADTNRYSGSKESYTLVKTPPSFLGFKVSRSEKQRIDISQTPTLPPSLPVYTTLSVPKQRKHNLKRSSPTITSKPIGRNSLPPAHFVQPLQVPRKRGMNDTQVKNEKFPSTVPDKVNAKSKAVEDKIKLFERKTSEAYVKPVKGQKAQSSSKIPVAKDALRLKPTAIKPTSVEKSRSANEVASERVERGRGGKRELSALTLNAIATEFRDLEANLKAGKLDQGDSVTSCNDSRCLRDVNFDGTSDEADIDMVIKEAECEMREPKPVRLVEMRRMLWLCGGKVDRNMLSQKLHRSY